MFSEKAYKRHLNAIFLSSQHYDFYYESSKININKIVKTNYLRSCRKKNAGDKKGLKKNPTEDPTYEVYFLP